jgi:SnoaL-like domain
MSDFQNIAEQYIQLWNERETSARTRLLEHGWAREATYCDPMAQVAGHPDISALIGSVQERFPEFRFKLTTVPNGYGEHMRFSWGLGPAGLDPVIEGSDVVTLKGNRIERVVGFLDKLPS